MQNTDYINRLYKKTWETKGARFNAHSRLMTISKLLTYTISFNSAYLILLSVITLLPETTPVQNRYISLISIFFSLIILAVSIIEESANYKTKAERMHKCAREISPVYTEICQIRDGIIDDSQNEKVINLSSKYERIISKYDINHNNLDYEKFKAQNYKDYNMSYFSSITKLFVCNVRAYLFYYVSIFSLPIIYCINMLDIINLK